jgi:PAS domain S-box-containing protein
MLSQKSKFIFPILVFLILFLIFNQLSSWYENKLKTEENKVVLSELKAHRTSIIESIDKRFIILSLLKSYIEKKIPEQMIFNLENKNLNLYAKTLFESVNGIRVLQVSPSGVHTFVYPVKGNEKTFNKNLFKDKRTSIINALELTKNSKEIITNAPYKLRQGGFGLVARQAVREKNDFWGFVVMVLDMNYIFEQIGITNKNDKLNLAIYQDEKFIFGDKSLDYISSHKIPLIIANQKLTLMAENKVSLDSITLILINSAALFISFLSACLLYILLNKQIRLESSVIKSMQKLEEKNLELNLLIQEAPNPMMLHEEGGKILMLNQAWSDSSGFSLEEIPTLSDWIKNVYNEEKTTYMTEHINSLYEITEKVDEGEYSFLNKNKNLLTWQFYSSPLGLIDGKRTIITSAMDISELKDKEKILIQQSKMAAMGEMLENIAHQWRQPLSVISTASTGIKLKSELKLLDKKELEEAMNSINGSAQYLSQTIDNFKTFFDPSNSKNKECNISDILNKTLKLLDSQFKSRSIKIIKNIDSNKIVSIENEIIQALVNILNNARDILELKDEEIKLIFINSYEKDNILYVEILDNAGGIDEEFLDKVFEPYFTTKHQSQGTGIGLYMSEEIIRNHLNGTIKVKNETYDFDGIKYKGAKFTIELPLD